MNLIITNLCNRSCPYCFARQKVYLSKEKNIADQTQDHISISNVEIYLDFLENDLIKELKLLGGEPTLHPKLPEIIERGLRRNMKPIIFSNGLWPEAIKEYFSRKHDQEISFVINVNEPHLQSNKENNHQRECLKIAGNRAMLSFNIYRENFDLLFTIHLIESLGLKREIRIGLANPIIRTKNSYIRSSALKKVGKRLVTKLKELEKYDILGSLDCGFPLCMFNEKDLGSLTLTTRQGFASMCGSVIDVGPDLNLWHCFPLSGILNRNLRDFKNKEEIDKCYYDKFKSIRNIGSMNECINCKYLKRGQCTGGCLGRTIRSIESSGDPRLVEKICA